MVFFNVIGERLGIYQASFEQAIEQSKILLDKFNESQNRDAKIINEYNELANNLNKQVERALNLYKQEKDRAERLQHTLNNRSYN